MEKDELLPRVIWKGAIAFGFSARARCAAFRYAGIIA